MIQINDKQNCTGCTACMAVCPKNAISMTEDDHGFEYPCVDLKKCIDCGLCNKICPFDKVAKEPQQRDVYVAKHKDLSVLKESTSGGLFTAVSDYVLKQNGVVYGAVLDENIVVRHMRGTTSKERNRMRGSKYVQSDLGETFKQIRNDLTSEKLVLFTGTPCQVAGLKSFLGGKCDGLICMDLICHGVPSPAIYREHIRFLSKKLKTKVVDYKFRPKKWGWHIHRELVQGETREYHSSPYTDLWRELYYSRIATRPSCNKCQYSNLNRQGDITIGDCRGIDKILPDFGSYEGATLALINTENGKEIFKEISDTITYEQLNVDDVMQPPLRQAGQPNEDSDGFFADCRNYGYEKAIRKCCGRLYWVKYYVKKLVRRVK